MDCGAYLRGQYGERRAVRPVRVDRARRSSSSAFVAGNIMYPTYKVEVRAAYLENRDGDDRREAAHERELARARRARRGEPRRGGRDDARWCRRAAQAARWFDVKEHWIALGLFVSAALSAHPLACGTRRRDGNVIAPIVISLAW